MNTESELLLAIKDQDPASPALSDGRERQLNNAQLLDEVETVSLWLRQHELRGVAVLADNGPPQIILDLACLSVGCWNLLIPPFFTQSQRMHALRECQCRYLLTDQAADNHIASVSISGTPFYLFKLPVTDTIPLKVNIPSKTQKITFTSGSTGTPKGLCLSEAHLTMPAKAICAAMQPLSLQRHLSLLPMAVLLENIAGIYAALFAGVECIVPSLRDTGLLCDPSKSGQQLTACIKTHQANSAIVVPELLSAIVGQVVQAGELPDALRYLAVGGSHVSPALLSAATEVGLPVFEGYGLSEAGSVVSINLPELNRPGSVGRVLPHQSVVIADDGEIILRQKGFLGYCNGPLNHTAPANKTSYPTGDIGSIDADGYLRISGRKKNVLITSMGRNISPEWIETLLLAKPEILQAMVFGDGQNSLSALIVSEISETNLHRVIHSVISELPEYAQIGDWRIITPMTLDNGQLTCNGKIQRGAVMRHYNQSHAEFSLSAT